MTRAHRRIHLLMWLALIPAIFGVLIGALGVHMQIKSRLSHAPSSAQEFHP